VVPDHQERDRICDVLAGALRGSSGMGGHSGGLRSLQLVARKPRCGDRELEPKSAAEGEQAWL